MKGLWSRVKSKAVWLLLTVVCFCLETLTLSQNAWAGATFDMPTNYGDAAQTTITVSGWVDKIGQIVIPTLMGVFFIAGIAMAGMGIMAFANKDSNQQGGQGAWKKVAAGCVLMGFGVIIGVLRNTITGTSQ